MQTNGKKENGLPHQRYFKLCSGCGICNDSCTVNSESKGTGECTTNPQKIASHLLKLNDNIAEFETRPGGEKESGYVPPTYICTSCELCSYNCPYFVPFFHLLIDARKWLRDNSIEQLPSSVTDMENDILHSGNPFGYPKVNRDEWIKEEFPEQDEVDCVFYPGCQTAYQLFNTEKAILKILKISGISVSTPGKSDLCCGRPMYFSGREQDIEKAAQINVNNVIQKKAEVLVASCSSCYLAFKKNYPPIVGKLPFDVYHTTEYLNILLKENRLKFNKSLDKTIIYHDPCELGRVGGIFEPPRELLSAVPGVNLLEFEKNHLGGLCCGGGGLFEAVCEERSFQLGEDLVQGAYEMGADILATACPTCNSVFNMSKNNLKKKGLLKGKIKILDISEIIFKCI